MLKFEPLSEKQIKELNLLEPGTYAFECVRAVSHTSKSSGKESIKLDLNVKGQTRYYLITCYLTPGYIKLLKHFCDVGKLDNLYQSGCLIAQDCERVKGYVIVDIEAANGNYGAKNIIVDFVSDKVMAKPEDKTTSVATEFNDDIPF